MKRSPPVLPRIHVPILYKNTSEYAYPYWEKLRACKYEKSAPRNHVSHMLSSWYVCCAEPQVKRMNERECASGGDVAKLVFYDASCLLFKKKYKPLINERAPQSRARLRTKNEKKGKEETNTDTRKKNKASHCLTRLDSFSFHLPLFLPSLSWSSSGAPSGPAGLLRLLLRRQSFRCILPRPVFCFRGLLVKLGDGASNRLSAPSGSVDIT